MTDCPKDAMGRRECGEVVRWNLQVVAQQTSGDTVDVIISTVPPPRLTPFTVAFECLHGTTYYAEPTAEQHAKWREQWTP